MFISIILGNIIGYQHSTTRFWDLRTFYHHKEYSNKLKHSYPKPHQLAVHSKIFFSILLKANYPKNNLRLVETLKYNKLIKNQKTLKKKVYPKFNKNKINITLILASLKNFDQALINCLKKIKNFDNNYSFYLKDQLSSDAVLKIEETKMFKKFMEIWGNYKNSDLVIISNQVLLFLMRCLLVHLFLYMTVVILLILAQCIVSLKINIL